MTYRLRIADLPASERPRERLMTVGAKNLSEAELLAILIGTGQAKGNLSAIGLAQHILQELGRHRRVPLDVLRDVNPRELMRIPGIGPAKATTIIAAVELGKRTFKFRPNQRVAVDSPASAAAVLSQDLMWQDRERFCSFDARRKKLFIGYQNLDHWYGYRDSNPSPRNLPRNCKTGCNQADYRSQSSVGQLRTLP